MDADGDARVILARRNPFRLGAVLVEPSHRRLTHDDGRHEVLEPRVMQVLVVLADAHGALVSREDLLAACWEARFVSRASLNRVISRLRALSGGIGAAAFEIETLSKTGYRLLASSRDAIAPPAPRLALDRRWLIGGAFGGLVAILGSGVAIWRLRQPKEGPVTLAVMPFASPADDGLGVALTREIRLNLSRVAGLRTISELSAVKVAEAELPPRQIAERLGADLLVIGALNRADAGRRADIQLVDGRTQATVWSYEAIAGGDVVEISQALCGALLQEMVGRVATAGFTGALPPRRRTDPRAYLHVVRAETAFLRTRELRLRAAEAAAEAAADEAYAEAMAALAVDPGEVRALLTLASLARNGWSRRLTATLPASGDLEAPGLPFVRRALLSDPNDPAALAALGDHHRRQWDWAEAEALLARAVAADPGLVEARWAYGTLLGTLNRPEAGIEQAREVVRLDPEDVARRGYLLARLEYAAGHRSQALDRYRASLQRSQANLFDLRELYLTHLTEANAGALDDLVSRAISLSPRGESLPQETSKMLRRIAAAAAALRGRPEGFLTIIDADVAKTIELQATSGGRRGADLLFSAALEYAWAGAADRAVATLARAVNAGSLNWTASLPHGRSPFPSAVRSDPRFDALWRRDARLADLVRRRRENGQVAG